MTSPPEVDGRTKADLLDEIRRIAPYYTEEWDPDSEDAGTVLFELFSGIAAEVVERLDRVPEKHRVSFFDELGFSRSPPQPSRLPLVFRVSDGTEGNVVVPAGTRVTAAAPEGGPERTFEIPPGAGFDATPSKLERVYGVDPGTDGIFEHTAARHGGGDVRLFDGRDRQEHALYIGDDDLLRLTPGSAIRVELETNAPRVVLDGCLEWEYYGERVVDGETVTDWHPLGRLGPEEPGRCPCSELRPVRELLEDEELRRILRWYGYVPAGPYTVDREYRLLTAIAADIRDGIDGRPGPTDRGRSEPRSPLPGNLLPAGEVADGLADRLRAELRSVAAELRSDAEAAKRWATGPRRTVALTFELPGATVDRVVSGHKSRWIRCKIPETELSRALFDIEIESVSLRVGPGAAADAGELTPDTMLRNDVPLGIDGRAGDLHPFGTLPQPLTAFYLASEEAFTKTGMDVGITFDPPASTTGAGRGDAGGAPEVSWEYWNGTGWARIPGLRAETVDEAETMDAEDGDAVLELSRPGTVRFTVPDDLARTAVSGHDGHWVRARLVSGDYGAVTYERSDADGETWSTVTEHVRPPRFGAVRIGYRWQTDERPAPDHLVTANNLEFSDDPSGIGNGSATVTPFSGPKDAAQTVYVGFDGGLNDGPINLFLSMAEKEYPSGFRPRARWEYRGAPGEGWSRLRARDGTGGLAERGLVSLEFPEATASFELFGQDLYWIRARLTVDEFAPIAATAFEPEPQVTQLAPRGIPPQHVETLRPELPAGTPEETPPVLRGLFPNTGWGHDVRTVDGEILGSSDGSLHQSFVVSTPPVIDEEVWVDELSALSEGARRELSAARPAATEEVTGAAGDPRAFWVRWTRVDDFHGSGPDARHYTLDRAVGRLSFGDGVDGMIPPRGRDNVRTTYRTGGGEAGNVEANAVAGLKGPIPGIDSVTNPEPADGGIDEESMGQLLERAPKRLRHRGRAVSKADFEAVAMAASRGLAKVRCLPGMDREGDRTPGWVTLLVVPERRATKPTPSVELKGRVFADLSERVPAALVPREGPRLVVRGPSYVEVSVEASLDATGVESITALEETVAEEVTAFLHPLTGGRLGRGWEFGELPRLPDFYVLLDRIDGIDHVEDISLTFRGNGSEFTVREGDTLPDATPDALVFSGTHEIRVTGAL